VDWGDRERQTLFAGFVLGIARGLGIKIRWGGDWDQDWDREGDPTADPHQTFNDWPHWELA